MFRKTVSLILSFILVFVVVFNASASANSTEENTDYMAKELGISVKEYNRLVSEYNSLTPEEKEELAIQELALLMKSSVEDVKLELDAVSDLRDFLYTDESGSLAINAQEALKSRPEHSKYILTIQNDFMELKKLENENNINSLSRASCEGENAFTDNAIFEEAKFDSCHTTKLISLLNIGAGVAALAAAISLAIFPPAAFALTVAAAVLAIGAGVLRLASSDGCGIKVSKLILLPWAAKSQC